MARIEHSHLPSYFDETIEGEEKYTLNLYNIPNNYNYNKDGYLNQTSSENSTYRGTIEIPAGLTQKGVDNNYPLMHAKDIQIGNNEANRLTDKLADYDQILRELYGREPNKLEDKPDGRTDADIATLNQQEKRSKENNNLRTRNGDGLQSLDKIATVLNNRTETIDDRLLDLRIIKTIAFGAESEASANPRGAKEDIIADNNGDTLTISPSNKWVKIFSSAEDNSFTIGHLVLENIPNDTRIAANVDINHKADYNFNDNINGFDTNDGLLNKFDVDRFQYDDAGHVIAYHKHTYELPKGFKFIAVNTGHSTDTDNNAGVGAGTCTAEALADTLTLYMGNKWINIAALRAGTQNNANNCITFSHNISSLDAGEHRLEYTTAALEPAFGATFKIAKPIYSFTTDEAGHVTDYNSSDGTVTVKIPEPSLAVAKDINELDIEGNVIVALNWDLTDKGKLIYTPAYIGSLVLTGYTALNEDSTGVAATDTLNNAIAKLQKQIEDEVAARIKAIEDEVSNRNTAIDQIYKKIYGKENISDADTLTLVSLNSNLNDTIQRIYGNTIPPIGQDIITLTSIQSFIDNLDANNIVVDKTASVQMTLTEFAKQKLNVEEFQAIYNNLIDQLATDLNWTDERKAELYFNIPVEEEPPENTGE